MKDSLEMVKTAVKALDDKKAEDIRVLDISNVSIIADYFIIAHGNNVNQIQAITDNVQKEMSKAGYELKSMEGHRTASWVLLDYTDIILHIFSKEDRLFYNLEHIWKDGKPIEIDLK